ncbi:MAG: hypothetical protein ACOYMF_05980 [Bacteroidales bacterium]
MSQNKTQAGKHKQAKPQLPKKGSYEVPEGEENSIHVLLETERFVKGTKVSEPFVQKFGKNEWRSVKNQLQGQGYTVEVLFAPEGVDTDLAGSEVETKDSEVE